MCCRGEPAAGLPALPLLPLPGAACTRAGGQGQARWRRPCCSQGQPLFCGVDQFIPRGPPHPAGALAGGVCRVSYITCVSCRLAPGCVLRVLGIKFCAAGRQRRGLPAPRLYRPRPPPFCTKIPRATCRASAGTERMLGAEQLVGWSAAGGAGRAHRALLGGAGSRCPPPFDGRTSALTCGHLRV